MCLGLAYAGAVFNHKLYLSSVMVLIAQPLGSSYADAVFFTYAILEKFIKFRE